MLSKPYLIDSNDLSSDDLEIIFTKAKYFKENFDGSPFNDLKNVTTAFAFFEPSTRTKLSFELAAKRLSGTTISYDFQSSSQLKGETLVDTIRTMEAMQVDLFVVRHSTNGTPEMLQKNTSGSIINAGDGTKDHPTQGLLDAFTLIEKYGDLSGLKVTIVGGITNSRVAQANIKILRKLNVEVFLCGPKQLLPTDKIWEGKIFNNIDDAIEKSDVIMLLRLQKERMDEGKMPSMSEYIKFFGLSSDNIDNKNISIMHPGPVNYGVELDWEINKNPNCLIQTQVQNGVFIRMAVLSTLAEKYK